MSARILLLLSLIVISMGLAQAQPAITQVSNSASYAPTGLPAAGLAQGSIFVVIGRNLGPANLVLNTAARIPTVLENVRIRVTVGATTLDAFMLYVSAGQLAAILPSNTPLGTGTVTAVVNGTPSSPFPITVVRFAFGIYTLNSAGSGAAVVTDAANAVITLTTAANPGQILVLWGTGLGAIATPDDQPAAGGDFPLQVEVFVGNKPAQVLYRGRTPGLYGLDQINFQVPAGVEGCGVSLTVRLNGANGVPSNWTTLPVAPTGRTCSDPGGFSQSDLNNSAGRSYSVGTVNLSRTSIKFAVPGLGSFDSVTESGSGSFMRWNFDALLRASTATGTSIGSCTVAMFSGQTPNPDPITPLVLDAGPVLNLTGPNGPKQLTKGREGFYTAQFTTSVPGGPPGTSYLVPGAYTVNNGTGGADVGAFTASLQLPQPLTWTNQDSINNVPRNSNLQINWTGGAPDDTVMMIGASSRTNPSAGATFICIERASAGGFSIPSAVLSALPVSTVTEGIASGILAVGSAPLEGSRFNASGINVGVFSYSVTSGKAVAYQ